MTAQPYSSSVTSDAASDWKSSGSSVTMDAQPTGPLEMIPLMVPMAPVAENVPTKPPSVKLSTHTQEKSQDVMAAVTQLQLQSAQLLHLQSSTVIEIPAHLTVIRIGKPNDRVIPDIDVSGFANSNVVSRIHADIRREGDTYYIEDVGSSNGTYINNTPLPIGNRHRLRPGDRISLGKGDLVTFLFQYSPT
jgi:pSer/pThr/pTyr-binding forkhead associated (FHA) protein